MRLAEAERTAETSERPIRGGEDRTVWHNALTFEDLTAALAGKPYDAMCGKRCHGARGVSRHVDTLRPIERCQVCADLVAGGQRIEL